MITLGIDIGTTSICGALYSSGEKRVICAKTIPHDAQIASEDSFAHLMDAERLIALAQQLYTELTEHSPEKIAGICVTGQMYGIVYVDREGKAASPLYTWMDMRGNLPRGEGESYGEYYTNLTGYPLKSGYGALTHLYHLEQHCVPEDAVKLCTIMDLAAMRLCGGKTPVTDSTNAASLGFFDGERNRFDFSALPLAGTVGGILSCSVALRPRDRVYKRGGGCPQQHRR